MKNLLIYNRAFLSRYKGDTLQEFQDPKPERTKSTNKEDTIESVRVVVYTDTLGTYTCEASYQDVHCSSVGLFKSAPVTVTMVEKKTITDPDDATVTAGASHVFICVFPDPFGDTETPDIEWLFNDEILIRDGNYHSESDNTLLIDGLIGTDLSTTSGELETTLTIAQVYTALLADSKHWGYNS